MAAPRECGLPHFYVVDLAEHYSNKDTSILEQLEKYINKQVEYQKSPPKHSLARAKVNTNQ
jgi:hypothetical protein